MAKEGEEQSVDEELYSRQLYVLGHMATSKLATSRVLISGLGGLGVEIAKDIILSGVKSVTLHDTREATLGDLTSQFFLTRDDLGKNRASACCTRLADLNPHVSVTFSSRPLTPDFLLTFKVVVLTDSNLEEQLTVSEVCHNQDVSLIVASTKGLFGQLFCDFGRKFEVLDPTGREPVSFLVESITKEEEGVVTLPAKTFHRLQDGDLVTFSKVRGMTQLNQTLPHTIKVVSPSSFSIGDTRGYPDYEGGGVGKEVRVGKTMSFSSLRESLAEPDIVCMDIAKEEVVGVIHQAFLTLHEYVARRGSLPRPWHDQDADIFLKTFYEVNETRRGEAEEVDEALLRTFAYTASGDLGPVNAVIGSLAAQEVIKASSGKFTPLHQWLYFDALECLPEDTTALREGACHARGGRYDAQIAIFGRDFQERLGRLRYFVVGAGAIGCELLKNFAMMGVGGGEGGNITVTDMDIIERSNLSRQFLFRPWDVKKPKSDTAAAAVATMNPDVRVVPHQLHVGPETEHVYDANFYESLDGVANALDNVQARRYMDRCCWQYQKPLLESGTLGTNGSVQVVVPHLTERYTIFQTPSGQSVPMCTLRNFPSAIEHTIQWARNLFQGEFCNAPEIARQYIAGTEKMEDILQESSRQDEDILQRLKSALVDDLPTSYDECVAWARRHWQDLYHNQILDLLRDLPPDLKARNGGPFWSGSKRCPHPLTFDIEDSLHLDYVHAAANLKAEVYGVQQVRDRSRTREILATVTVPSYVPTPKMVPVGELSERLRDLSISDLREAIPSPQSLAGVSLTPLSFEKDDDSNFHIDFIVAASNLRAGNYDIEPADRQRSKRIAGHILPAIVTSTALVSGLVSLELVKVTQGHRDISRYRNSEFNLALVRFCMTEPEPAPEKTYNGVTWTPWDRFEVEGDMTLQEFFQYFLQHHELRVTMVSAGDHTIHSFMLPRHERRRRTLMKITSILKEVMMVGEGEDAGKSAGVPQDHSLGPVLMLDICADDKDGMDVDVPHVRYTVRRDS